MVKASLKIIAFNNPAPGKHTHMFMCPGCGYAHCFSATVHKYNNDPKEPTLYMPVKIPGHLALFRCESLITKGMIDFSEHCTHQYAGFTMQLPNAKE